MTLSHSIEFIDTLPKLQEFCSRLKETHWVAVDTEFLRERTYFPKFCLLQMAHGGQVGCIDPLALDSLEPLEDILFDPEITKVVHSGRQDLEIFYQIWKRLPAPIFDTQIAAPLIGMGEQIGYAALVAELLGVNLGKGHTRTDWSLRPLAEDQIRYAADDVIYLGAAYEALVGRLEALGRLHWLDADFAALTHPDLYEMAPDQCWQRVGGALQLKGRALSVLQALAAWRETTARELNIPRGWVVKDEVLLDLARLAPTDEGGLKRIRGLEERSLKRHGGALCGIIAKARELPPQPVEARVRAPRRTPDEEALLDLLGAVVRVRAAQHSLNPVILAGRRDLEELLDHPEQCRLLTGWRKTMAGEELAAILRGECLVTVADGRLHLRHHG